MLPEDVVRQILAERANGATLQAIIGGLNRDGIPTAKVTWARTKRAKAIADGKPVDNLPEPDGPGV